MLFRSDEKAGKEELREYVRESVEAFFGRTEGLNPKESGLGIKATVTVEKEPESPKKKGRTSRKATETKGKKSEAEIPDSPTGMTDTDKDESLDEKPKKKGRTSRKATETKGKKSKEGGKPKCEGVTAKGTRCTKCAVEGEVLCSIHLKKKAGEKAEVAPKKKEAKKSKKEEAPEHTHEIGEKPEDEECEVCEKYGDVFEVPEYEEDKSENGDPTYTLEEEDFDEDDE